MPKIFEATDDSFIITTDPVIYIPSKKRLIIWDSPVMKLIGDDSKILCRVRCETAKENLALIEWLEELEDVDAVYHNMKIPDELQ